VPEQEPPLKDHLAYLLAQASREINRQLESRLSDEGVPLDQWRILKVLSDLNGHSMGDLADAVLLNHPTLTKIIDRMVSDALVYRVPDSIDRRRVLIFISDRGRLLNSRLEALVRRQEADFVHGYGSQSVVHLKRLLEGLVGNARRIGDPRGRTDPGLGTDGIMELARGEE